MMFNMSLKKMAISHGFKGSEEHSKLCNRKGKDPQGSNVPGMFDKEQRDQCDCSRV